MNGMTEDKPANYTEDVEKLSRIVAEMISVDVLFALAEIADVDMALAERHACGITDGLYDGFYGVHDDFTCVVNRLPHRRTTSRGRRQAARILGVYDALMLAVDQHRSQFEPVEQVSLQEVAA